MVVTYKLLSFATAIPAVSSYRFTNGCEVGRSLALYVEGHFCCKVEVCFEYRIAPNFRGTKKFRETL